MLKEKKNSDILFWRKISPKIEWELVPRIWGKWGDKFLENLDWRKPEENALT